MTFDSARIAEDSALLEACRGSDQLAFATLWERHHRAGLAAARSIAPHLDADDLVAEAYTRILALVQRGKGPTGAFRPYLYRVITSLTADWSKTRETSSDELDSIPDLAASGPWEDEGFDHRATATAFASLHARWQAVLWYTEVEGLAPREVASIIGISANSVSALALRARDGLRSAWVEAHINTALADEACRLALTRLQRHQRGKLTSGLAREVDAHLAGCPRCRSAAQECSQLNEQLALVLLWVFVGGGSATALYALLQPAAAAGAAAGGAAGFFPAGPGTTASATTASATATAAAPAAGASAASIAVIAGGSALALAVAAGVGAWAITGPFAPATPVTTTGSSEVSEVTGSPSASGERDQQTPSDEAAPQPDDGADDATLPASAPGGGSASGTRTGAGAVYIPPAAPDATAPEPTPPTTPPAPKPDPEPEPGPGSGLGSEGPGSGSETDTDPGNEPGTDPGSGEEGGSGTGTGTDPSGPGEDASLSPGSPCFITYGSNAHALFGVAKHSGGIRVRVTTAGAPVPLELWDGDGHTTDTRFGGLWFTPSLATLADWGAPETTFEMLTSIEVQFVASDGRYSPWQQVDRGDRC